LKNILPVFGNPLIDNEEHFFFRKKQKRRLISPTDFAAIIFFFTVRQAGRQPLPKRYKEGGQ